VNLAAQAGVRYSLVNPHAYAQSNVVGFLNLLECCRKHSVKHLVYASTSSVYGLNKKSPFAETDNVDHPVSLYAATKKSNELMAHSYSHLFRIPTTGLRFFTVYGPWGRPDMAMYLFAKSMKEGKPIQVFNYGKMRRDFTYIDDIVQGVTRVLFQPAEANPAWDGTDPSNSLAPYRVYNIGNNKPVELLYAIELLEKELGITAFKQMQPLQAGDVESTFADIDALAAAVAYSPSTPIEIGIKKFVQWFKDYEG
jgi:UDP-glucuronate 4-epimerase